MKKVENFLRSYENLKDIFDYEEPYGNVELSGMVALFEICFEQAWKAMKEILSFNGFEEGKTGSPRLVIKTAFAATMIKDEDAWLSVLNARNNVAHAYKKEIALDIVRKTKEEYYLLFGDLIQEIEENDWIPYE